MVFVQVLEGMVMTVGVLPLIGGLEVNKYNLLPLDSANPAIDSIIGSR